MHLFSSFRRGHLLLGGVWWIGLVLWTARLDAAPTNSPPTITQQPAGGIAGVGEDFAFTVEASGTPPLTFQWFVNGSTIAGQTNASLLLTNLTAAQSGFYLVNVQNVVTNVLSTNALLTVQADVPRRLGTGRAVQSGSQVAVSLFAQTVAKPQFLFRSLIRTPFRTRRSCLPIARQRPTWT